MSSQNEPIPELHVFLKRINPDTNTHRWYTVTVQKDLFGRISLVTAWGSLKSAYYKQQIKHPDNLQQAYVRAEKIVKAKIKKGYVRTVES